MANQLYDADHLYALLPEVYRLRDRRPRRDGRSGLGHQGQDGHGAGALYDLVTLLAREARVVARDIERLHENSFIETCDPWAVPYIGDLLGVEGLRDDSPVSARAEVAHTIGYRKRKGTAAVLEQLARDVTGWPARVVEAFELLAWSQFVLNHVRPEAVATASIRNAAAMEKVSGAARIPFDTAAHTVDIGRVAPREGRHNIPHVAVHLFRLYALPQLLTTPEPQAAADDDAQIGPTRFRFSPLGHDAPLFTHPEAETGSASIAEEKHVPVPIGYRTLHADLEGPADVYLHGGGSIAVLVPETGADADGWELLRARYVACDLEDWDRPLPNAHDPEEVGGVVAVDPVLGRLRFENGERMPEVFRLSSYHGLPDLFGGGQYERSPLADVSDIPEDNRLRVGDPTDLLLIHRDDIDTTSARFFDQLEAALASPWPADGDRLIEIVDSRTYDVGLASLEIPQGRRLVLRAEDRQRPTVRLAGTLEIVGQDESRLELDGLWIGGAGLEVVAPPEVDGEAVPGLNRLELRHVTLVPGHALDPDGAPATPGAVSLRVETGETEVTVERSILGAVESAPETTFPIADSILDAHGVSPQSEPEVNVAFGGLGGGSPFGGILEIRRSTVFGRLVASAIRLGENTLFMGDAVAERRQEGCVRYSWVTPRSRVPGRYRCQPALEVATLREVAEAEGGPAPDARRVERRLRPRFTSRTHGRPAYAQLDWRLASQILRGADNGSEMGVYCALQGPLREDDLRRRLDEYLPASLEAGIFYGT